MVSRRSLETATAFLTGAFGAAVADCILLIVGEKHVSHAEVVERLHQLDSAIQRFRRLKV